MLMKKNDDTVSQLSSIKEDYNNKMSFLNYSSKQLSQKLKKIDKDIDDLDLGEKINISNIDDHVKYMKKRTERSKIANKLAGIEGDKLFYNQIGIPNVDGLLKVYKVQECHSKIKDEISKHLETPELKSEINEKKPMRGNLERYCSIVPHVKDFYSKVKGFFRRKKKTIQPAPDYDQVTPRYYSPKTYMRLNKRISSQRKRINSLETKVNNLESIIKANDPKKPQKKNNNFDIRYANKKMVTDMIKHYCTNYDQSLETISKDLGAKYGMNVSTSTIRKYARDELGYDINRRDKSAMQKYKTLHPK